MAGHPNPVTIASADFLLLLVTVSAWEMSADDVIATYRLRWKNELAFKPLKSGLGIDALPVRDSQLARSWLAAYLIVGLLIDEAVAETLAFPPCVVGAIGHALVVMAHPEMRKERYVGRDLRKASILLHRSDPRQRRQNTLRATSTKESQFSLLRALPN